MLVGLVAGGLTAVPETIYGAASQIPKYANPLNMAMLPLEAAAPVAGYFVSIGAGFQKGGITGSSAAIMAPIAVAGVGLSNPMNVGYMAGAAVSTMGYMELAAVRPVEVRQGVFERNFGILGKETTIIPSSDIAGQTLMVSNPKQLPSGVTRYDLTRNIIGKVERTGAVSGQGIFGKILFPSSEGAVTPKMFSYNLGYAYKTSEGWSLSTEKGILEKTRMFGYTSEGIDLPASAKFAGKMGRQEAFFEGKPLVMERNFRPLSGEVLITEGQKDVSTVISKTYYPKGSEGFFGYATQRDVLAPALKETPQSVFFQEYLFAKAGTREFVDIFGAGTKANVIISSSTDSFGFGVKSLSKEPITYNLRIIAAKESAETGSFLQLGETIGGKQVTITGSAPLVSAQQLATESIFRTPTLTQSVMPKSEISLIGGAQVSGMSAAISIQKTSQPTTQRTTDIPKMALAMAPMVAQPTEAGTVLKLEQMTRTPQRIEPVQVSIPKTTDLTITSVKTTEITSTSLFDRTMPITAISDATIISTITPTTTQTTSPTIPAIPAGFDFGVETPPPPPIGFGGFQLGSTGSIWEERPAKKQKKRYSPDIISLTLGIKTPKGKKISDITGGMIRPMFGSSKKKRR